MTADWRTRGWLALVVVLGASAGGCVNTYVVDPPGAGSSGEPDAATSAEGELDSSGSEGATAGASSGGTGGAEGSTNATGSTGVPPPDSTGDSLGDTGEGSETGPSETCEPCTADDQCGGEFDLCVVLDAEPACLSVCMEGPRMCPFETTCMPVTSVDGANGQQCVPDSGSCTVRSEPEPLLVETDRGSREGHPPHGAPASREERAVEGM